ncbi:MAG: saccharopine dehydrogenase NADP-binding domain-containing protein [bacterium]|nr:saccharopine dehydrogenase NADP-binding domain-containing protein [bacterium]
MKKVLVLGAGMVARPLVRYLLDRGFGVTQGDLEPGRASAMIDGHPHGRALAVDVCDTGAVAKLVAAHDLTVSLAPPPFHPAVARLCVDAGRHMATASYVAPETAALDAAARARGVLLLNEIGVDPGIDHMSAMRVIDGVRARGGRLLSFRSYCGGLPAPEANDNPFGYKFSWAPRGVLMAGRNDARYLSHGELVTVPGARLFRDMHLLHVEGAGDFEAYPNRDSISYIDIYGLQGIRTMFRGTLRNPGWCDCLHHYGRLGLLDLAPTDLAPATAADLLRRLAGGAPGEPADAAVARRLGLCRDALPVANLRWLGLCDETPLARARGCPLDVLGDAMLAKLIYAPGERDMIAMKHEFVAALPDGGREMITSSLVAFGEPGGDSAMARTVSLPLAVAVRLTLEGAFAARGVARPVSAEFYGPILGELETLGIVCREETVWTERDSGHQGGE